MKLWIDLAATFLYQLVLKQVLNSIQMKFLVINNVETVLKTDWSILKKKFLVFVVVSFDSHWI